MVTKEYRQALAQSLKGEDQSIELAFEKLPLLLRANYWVISGMPGTGKTSLADELFILNLIDSLEEYKIKWIYHSLERPFKFKVARWLSNLVSKHESIDWSMHTMLQTKKRKHSFKETEQGIISHYADLIDSKIGNNMVRFQGTHDVTKIRGNIHKTMTRKEFREADFVIHICDHLGRINDRGNEIRTIKDYSNMIADARDQYGITAIDIMQLSTKKIMDAMRKNRTVDISTADAFGSSVPEQNCDVFLGILDPKKVQIDFHRGYDLNKLSVDDSCPYREIKVLKSSNEPPSSTDAFFKGKVGRFFVAPSVKDLDYNSVKEQFFI